MAVYRRSDTKSKRWFYKFEIDGVNYKSSIPTARTRRQAEEAERQARDDVHAGRYNARRRSMTFANFLDEHYLPWVKLHRRDYEGRLMAVNALRPYFDHLPLDRISQITVERFKLDHSKALTRQDKQYKPATVNQRLHILSAVLSRAVALKITEPTHAPASSAYLSNRRSRGRSATTRKIGCGRDCARVHSGFTTLP